MPAPIPDLSRDQQCHHYQAPTGHRCGSPALKGEYYCYFHHIKHAKRAQQRVLIDPEVTCMELPPIEDRATIFVALAAVVHRLAANTIDTRRAGQMIYALQTALQALQALPAPEPAAAPPAPPPTAPSTPTPPAAPPPAPTPTVENCHAPQNCHSERSEEPPYFAPATTPPKVESRHAVENCHSDPECIEGEESPYSSPAPTPPKKITITKESLLYFLRSRHCYNCNAELFPAEDLTERSNPGVTSPPIEENELIKRLGECQAPLPHRASTVVPSSAERSASNAPARNST